MIKLQVITHSGDIDEISVESYDAEDIANQINSNETLVIVIGDYVYSRIDIKQIKKIK